MTHAALHALADRLERLTRSCQHDLVDRLARPPPSSVTPPSAGRGPYTISFKIAIPLLTNL